MSFHSQRIPPPFVSYPTASATLQAQGCLAEGSRTVSSSGNSLVDAPPTRFQSLAPIASPLADWMKFALLGALIEFARRSFSFIWAALVGMFFITVRFDDDSEAYDYVMVWLSKCNAWKGARELQASTRESDCYLRSDGNVIALPNGSGRPSDADEKLVFLPGFGSTHTFFYNGTPIQIYRQKTSDGFGHSKESLTLSMFGRERKVLDHLLVEARGLYKERQEKSIVIWQPDMLNMWRRRGTRARRPMSSIILDSSIKEALLEDARDFLGSSSWYSERGIPFRRGYLLHGEPGSGKTSLIHAIAGELNLDIYVISLSKPGMNDTALGNLLCDLPPRCIALIEDIDAAFTCGVNRDDPVLPVGAVSLGFSRSFPMASGPSVTLSGLLNAIDGIYAQEGRILFATTNAAATALDTALIRPGRLDVHFHFGFAVQSQARDLFKCFYPAQPVDEEGGSTSCPPPSATRESFPLTTAERDALADAFADAVPEQLLSMATLQGYLLRYKTQPRIAVQGVKDFAEAQRRKKDKDWEDVGTTETRGVTAKAKVAPRDA